MATNDSPAKGSLYLIPCPLGDGDPSGVLPPDSLSRIAPIRDFVVENEKSAWRFLSRILGQRELDSVKLSILNEHSEASDVAGLLGPALAGRPMGLVSEAGCPGVADPGAPLVRLAHGAGIPVVPLVGPSSILMALMASGMNGQSFRFSGYLPRERQDRIRTLKDLEKRARESGETQIFIEAPYRNEHMLSDMGDSLKPETLVCLASELSLPGESVVSVAASEIPRLKGSLGKRPTVFLIGLPNLKKRT
jgi:16S rRNA (cytidine1402-2'-O)-methyltransferase